MEVLFLIITLISYMRLICALVDITSDLLNIPEKLSQMQNPPISKGQGKSVSEGRNTSRILGSWVFYNTFVIVYSTDHVHELDSC